MDLLNNAFAAFVITYKRANILPDTLAALFGQSLPPALILVVDNSPDDETRRLIAERADPRVAYHKMGYNAGPAGAARYALEYLSNQGYKCVYWGDDNNAPKFQDDFERLIKLHREDTGIVAAVGHKFNKFFGRIERFNSAELTGILEADTAGGGDCMLISTTVVREGILPDARLFFGFEELDFCIRIREKGFRIIVDGERFYQYRAVAGNLNKKAKVLNLRNSRMYALREYYGKRNLIYIYKKHRMFAALLNLVLKTVVKSLAGFRYGFRFGALNMRMMLTSLMHGLVSRMGKTFDLR
ncbi:MAG TPA: glycosyltransferase [Chryseosolibacter sp.]|nr:glycosyltransferase [Chryseosolibacter sp.]